MDNLDALLGYAALLSAAGAVVAAFNSAWGVAIGLAALAVVAWIGSSRVRH